MQAVQNGKFLNPFRAAQTSEEFLDPAKKFYNFGEWKLPEGASASMTRGDPTIILPIDVTIQARRMFGRFVWSKLAPGHINPVAPGGRACCVFQFAAKVSFVSKRYDEYRAPIFARSPARPSGAHRRERSQP